MQFNDTTNKTGIIQDIEGLLGFADGTISGDSTLLKSFTRMINHWYRTANQWIWQVTGTWEYDDSNYTDFPIATTNLVDGQKDYTIPSTAQKILRVEVKDNEGNWHELTQLDLSMINGAVDEYFSTDGLPLYYDITGRSLMLYPAPSSSDVTLTDGLKLYFTRDIDEFDSTDTTKEPGFDKAFHRILSVGPALDYAMANGMRDKVSYLSDMLSVIRSDLERFYGERNDTKEKLDRRIRPRIENYE